MERLSAPGRSCYEAPVNQQVHLVLASSLVLAALSGTAAARPQSSISEASALGYPFLVHGGSGDGALLIKIRDAADRAWRAEIDQGGWPSPAPDRAGPDD